MTTTPNNLNDLVGNIDASIWAKAFVSLIKDNPSIASDEKTMLGWFANAIGTGYDKGHDHSRKIIENLPISIVDILNKKQNLTREIEVAEKQLRQALSVAVEAGNINTVSALTKSLQSLSDAWAFTNAEIADCSSMLLKQNTANMESNYVRQD